MAAGVSEKRWREAQEHERDFWEKWRALPAYRGLDLAAYWEGETRRFALPDGFFAGRRVLDVGSGPVGMIHFLPEAALRVRLDPLLPEYRDRLPLAEPQLSLAAGGERLPLADASVDIAVCFNAIDHVRDPLACLNEIQRVLRPGGTFLVMVHDFPAWALPLLWPDRLHPHHWTHAQARRLIETSFRVAHAEHSRRHFDLPLRALLSPANWKYAAGNLILHTCYFRAVK